MTMINYPVTADTIYTAQGLQEQVMNFTDWAGAEITPTAFMLFNALGQLEPVKNNHFLMNDTIGTERIFAATANFTIAAAGSVIDLNLNTIAGKANNMFRPGMGFRIAGYNGAAADDRMDALVIIEGPSVTGGWNCKVLDVVNYTDSYTYDYDSAKGGTYFYLTNAEELNSSAPQSSNWYPTQRNNYTQLYRVPWGVDNDTESSDTLFGNVRANNQKEAESILLGSIEHDILFSQNALKAGSTDSSGMAQATGTGSNKSIQGGIPHLLGMTNLSLTKTKYHSESFSGVTTNNVISTQTEAFTFIEALYAFADKFDATNETLLFLTSKNMRSLIRQALKWMGDSHAPGVLAFPRLSFNDIDLGHIRLRMIVSDELSKGLAPYVYDGTNYIYGDYFGVALNMKHVGIKYRAREKYGIMAPKDMPLVELRNEFKYESEMVAELGVALEHRHKHGVFFLYA